MSKNKHIRVQPRPDPAVSQNFLTSRRLLDRIVGLSSIGRDDLVIEIGTGKGHLTQVLARKCGVLHTVEIDRTLFEKAKERLASARNVRLICGDFLRYPLPLAQPYKVFANIPYCLTTQIVNRLTGATNPPGEIWLVMEKGAAQRFRGVPRETASSLLLKTAWDMQVRYHFNREDFHPRPAVDSVLLHVARKPVPDLSAADLPVFRRFVAHSLRHGLLGSHGLLTRKQVTLALRHAGLPPLYENREALYVQWLCLFRCWRQQHRL